MFYIVCTKKHKEVLLCVILVAGGVVSADATVIAAVDAVAAGAVGAVADAAGAADSIGQANINITPT
ncbi:hypothetical protein [Aminipila terrae]|uniref:Secreted protein n=1 Tax=Aminipila terrae TaxID=2697030 RepID=A0A6P1MBP6_9FIRM|nr:hypothetical protein [Aminipila terrae]QHI71452.1 hypothetical protein Ami3637_02820 [Aminipila terrae]